MCISICVLLYTPIYSNVSTSFQPCPLIFFNQGKKRAMNKKHLWMVGVSVFLVALLSLLVFWRVKADKGQQLAEQLSQSLQSEGLPLQSVRVADQSPLTLEITLEYSMQDSPERKADILRDRHAVQWHCTQLNREHFQLSSYIVLIQNPSGQQLSWEQNFLYPGDAEDSPEQYSLNLSEANDYLREAFLAGSAQVERFELIEEQKDGVPVHTLTIQLVEPDLETLNRELPMTQIERLIMEVNEQKLFPVDICWLEIMGPKGETWVDYLYDYSLSAMNWWIADGVSTAWFPHPAPLPNQEQTATPPPSRLYPLGTAQPTAVNPYP